MILCRLVPGIYSWALSRFFVKLNYLQEAKVAIFKNELA